MTKVTIGVYKAFKNGGRFRFHRNKTKKHWKHYFIEVDDYDVNGSVMDEFGPNLKYSSELYYFQDKR